MLVETSCHIRSRRGGPLLLLLDEEEVLVVSLSLVPLFKSSLDPLLPEIMAFLPALINAV